ERNATRGTGSTVQAVAEGVASPRFTAGRHRCDAVPAGCEQEERAISNEGDMTGMLDWARWSCIRRFGSGVVVVAIGLCGLFLSSDARALEQCTPVVAHIVSAQGGVELR